MGVELAIGLFAALVGGIITFAVNNYNNDETTEGTPANQAKKQRDLAQSNLDLNTKVSEQNFELSKQQFEYQKQLNDTLMQREDTAMQRQVADLKAAGLSPLMVSGGASAAPLTSANAPQRDMSGINSALQNMFGAYNDIYNRKLNRQQFALQSRLQTAQTYANLIDTKNNIKKSQLEQNYLRAKQSWEEIHGFRDLSISSELTNILEQLINKKKENTVIPGIGEFDFSDYSPEQIKDKISDIISDNKNNSSYSPSPVIKYPTKKEIENDVSKINKANKEDYTRAMNILQTRLPTKYNLDDKKYMSAVTYVYRHTDAWRRFETTEEFINALKNDVFRKDLKKTYPYKNRSVSDY